MSEAKTDGDPVCADLDNYDDEDERWRKRFAFRLPRAVRHRNATARKAHK